MSDSDDRPLPYGWVKQWDANYERNFYVDSKANPPRSIWVHPYEDDQYLREHPEVREKVRPQSTIGASSRSGDGPSVPPPDSKPRRNSFGGSSNQASSMGRSISDQDPLNKGKNRERRGFLGKIKDAMIGTKEEREASRIYEQNMREERRKRAQEQADRQFQQQQRMYEEQQRMYQQQQQQQQQQQRAMYQQPPPQQYGGGYAPGGYGPQGGYYAPQSAPPPRRSGFGGIGLPLIGGLAGGLLLGDALDGFDGGDGGDFGGDGGDFGGGDFGGDF